MPIADPPRSAVNAPKIVSDGTGEAQTDLGSSSAKEDAAEETTPRMTGIERAEHLSIQRSPAARHMAEQDPAMCPTAPGLAIWVAVVGLLFLVATVSSFVTMM